MRSVRIAAAVAAAAATAATAGCARTPHTRPVDTREDLVQCGAYDVKQGDHLPASAIDCLVEAVQTGQRAYLAQTRPTIEGDPITTVYSVRRDGQVIVETDTTQDRFGNQGVIREACTGPRADGG